MNKTIQKFGYPETLVKEFKHWVILLRPKQITLGALILACKEAAESLPEVTENAYIEFPRVTYWLENTLTLLFHYDKINYLALMMKDKEVHFHVIPRYSRKKLFDGVLFFDHGWPKYPNLSETNEISSNTFGHILSELKKYD